METQLDLNSFTGTESYWKTCLFAPKLVHTDGVQYFADHANAYWFLDIVATEFYPLTKTEPFLAINMQVEDGKFLEYQTGGSQWSSKHHC